MSQTTRSIVLIITSVVLSSSGQTVLKFGLDRLTEQDKENAFSFVRSAMMTWQVWVGLILFAVSVLVWMRVLASNDLSWGYPMLGLSYVLVALAGWLVFHEEFTFQRLAGIALVIAGAILVGRS